jgi:hypothetical protein
MSAVQLAQHGGHVAAAMVPSRRVGTYQPPCGCAAIATMIPPKGQVWDTFATCPACGSLHFMMARHEGVQVVTA